MSDGGGSTPADDKTDVFDEVIEKLEAASKAVGPLVHPVEEATTVVSDVTEVLDDIKSFGNALNDINDVLKILTEVLPSLTGIPFVGEVVDGFDEVLSVIQETLSGFLTEFDTIQKEIIDPVDKTLTRVQSVFSNIKEVIVDLSQKLPEFLNTIQILSFLARIVVPLCELLKGSAIAERLGKILSELNKVKTDVIEALHPVTEVFSTIEQAVKFIGSKLKSFFDSVGDTVKKALDGFKDAAHVLDTVKDVFDKILDAIKPIKWVLDAVEKLINKILKPVIDEILKVTGLQKLINTISNAILSKLGVKDVFDLLKKGLGVKEIESSLEALDPTKGQAFAADAGKLFMSLGKYKAHGTKDSPVSEVVMDELLFAITGTEVDPNKPSTIPPFPDIPGFSDGGSTQKEETHPTTVMSRAMPSSEAPKMHVSATPYPSRRNMNLQKLFSKVGCVGATPPDSPVTRAMPTAIESHSLPSPSPQAANVEGSPGGSGLPLGTTVDPDTWPQCAQALKTIDSLTKDVKSFSPTVTGLANSLEAFKSALQLSDTFQEQMHDLETILGTADDLMKLLISFDVQWITIIISPAKDVLENQKAAAEEASSAVPNLIKAVKDVSTAGESITNAMTGAAAKSNVLLNGKLQREFNGWSLGIRQLVAMVQEGRKRDPKAGCDGTTYEAKLDEMATTLESSASDLNKRLTSIDQQLNGVKSSVQQMMKGLSDFSTQLNDVSSHSNVIGSKALPGVHKAAHILGTIDSVIDPLTSLLKAEHCIGTDVKSETWKSAQLLVNNGSKAFVESSYVPKVFEEIAVVIADKVLPLGALKTNVDSATDILSNDVQKTFESKSSELLNAFKSLMQSLEATKSYTFDRKVKGQPPVKETIKNDFVTEQNLEDAKKLVCKPPAS